MSGRLVPGPVLGLESPVLSSDLGLEARVLVSITAIVCGW